MNAFTNGWFTELCPSGDVPENNREAEKIKNGHVDNVHENGINNTNTNNTGCGTVWSGQAISLKVDQEIFHKKSTYQDIRVFKSGTFGNVLVLDGMIQCTEKDEFSYQEMLAHLPLMLHSNPKKVLIIGGGDGGILREVVKHDAVESAILCEIDEDVINASKNYLPHMASGFSHPKATVYVGDGFEFMKKHQNEFDVIITDSSDPVGPAESLFGESYYELVRSALTENGILASQAESMWFHLDLIKHMMTFCRRLFPVVSYAYSSVPTYPSGVIGYLICSKDKNCVPNQPKAILTKEQRECMTLRYYNSDVHRAAFVLPEFVNSALSS